MSRRCAAARNVRGKDTVFGRSLAIGSSRGVTVIWMRVLVLVVALAGCDKLFSLDTVPIQAPDAPSIDAPLRPDAPAGACGLVGTPCCATGTDCTASVCLHSGASSRCVANAGAFGVQTLNACGTSECDADPFTGQCTCPVGFIEEPNSIDGGCGADLSNPMHSLTKLSMCVANAFTADSDWGDYFIQSDIPACTPATPDGCVSPNHITGACSCPAPTTPVPLRIFIQGTPNGSTCTNGWLGAALTLCLNPNVAAASVLGVYELDPDNTCRTSFPMGDCHCPGGALTSTIPVFTDRPLGNVGVTFMRSTITLCLAPP